MQQRCAHLSQAYTRLRCCGGTISAKTGLLQQGAGHALSSAPTTSTAAYTATVVWLPSLGRPCRWQTRARFISKNKGWLCQL